MFRRALTAFCLCVCVQSEDSVSMLQTNRLSVDKQQSSTSTIANVQVTTCTVSDSGSGARATFQFGGDKSHSLGPFRYKGRTYNFNVGVNSGTDLRSLVVTAQSSDGLCASSILVNGVEMLQGKRWFDRPCTRTSYSGVACSESFRFNAGPAPPKTSVSVTTCATSHAQSSGQFYIQFDGDKQRRKLGQMKSAAKTHTFYVDHDAAADLKKFTVSTDQTDGICATSIIVNGQEAMGQGSIWIDNPCTTYHYDGTSCHPSYTFDLTPAPIEIALPEFDMNEGNACKHGYNFVRTKNDCISAAKVLKLAGELGTFMEKEREVTNRPTGCYMQTNPKHAVYRNVIYNTHEVGATSVQAMIICKKA